MGIHFQITFAICNPSMLFEMVNSSMAEKYDVSSLKFLFSTGSALSLDIVQRIKKIYKVLFITGSYLKK